MSVNLICQCGHYRSIHYFFEYGGSYCTDRTKSKWCHCCEFKQDNLRYLEQLSEAQSIGK